MEISPGIIQRCDVEILRCSVIMRVFCGFFFCHFGLLSDRTSSDIRDKEVQSSHNPPGKADFQGGDWPLPRSHSRSALPRS